jgi:ribosomal protein L12E/L44/L45/RPP1/RPP2
MSKISLNKRIEATKLHERTGAPMAGPEVTIPFGALVEAAGADRDQEKFRYLGELYSVRRDIFLAATKADEAEPARAAAPAAARAEAAPEAPAKPSAKEAKLKFEQLDAGGYSAARAKVPGGWLVTCGPGVTFYPDPRHEWDGASIE